MALCDCSQHTLHYGKPRPEMICCVGQTKTLFSGKDRIFLLHTETYVQYVKDKRLLDVKFQNFFFPLSITTCRERNLGEKLVTT